MSPFRSLAAILCILALAACAAPMPTMQTADTQQEQAVPANKSRIVFMRSSFVGSLINSTLYDVTRGEPVFLGILPNASRIAYDTDPGEHTFMVQSEAADFLKATMTAGKTYYAIVTPRFGTMVARFSLVPVRADGRDGRTNAKTDVVRIGEMKTSTKLLANTGETKQWFENNLGDIKAKQAQYWPAWQNKPPADMAEVTLYASDGM